ncbi:hypothetical protein L1987_34383 [Smallanthus sonchifolius]|uniref:Uncharacterized protein n=1 Tax=Smallanthus sonchifolius TaxID=185202 RepID=A0ACB9HUI2_9ASTR|nr:hypothetical protein L1987_34383 [Smallanthus sonchifolius]
MSTPVSSEDYYSSPVISEAMDKDYSISEAKKEAILSRLTGPSKAVRACDMYDWVQGEHNFFEDQVKLLGLDFDYSIEDVESDEESGTAQFFANQLKSGNQKAQVKVPPKCVWFRFTLHEVLVVSNSGLKILPFVVTGGSINGDNSRRFSLLMGPSYLFFLVKDFGFYGFYGWDDDPVNLDFWLGYLAHFRQLKMPTRGFGFSHFVGFLGLGMHIPKLTFETSSPIGSWGYKSGGDSTRAVRLILAGISNSENLVPVPTF